MPFGNRHRIDWPESFHLREPVLRLVLGNARWDHDATTQTLGFDLPLSNFSSSERAIIEFALNPYMTAEKIFALLSKPVATSLADALHALFGSNGFY